MGNKATTLDPRLQDILQYIHPEVKEYVLELEAKVQTLQEKERQLEEYKKQLLSLEEDNKKLKVEHEKCTSVTTELIEKNDALMIKTIKLDEEIKLLQLGAQHQKELIETKEMQCKLQADQLITEKIEKGDICAKYLVIQNELKTIQEDNKRVKSEIEVVSQLNRKKCEEIENIRYKCQNAVEQKELIQIENYTLRDEISKLRIDVDKLKGEASRPNEVKYLDMQEELFGLQIQNHEYKKQITELTKACDRLSKIKTKNKTNAKDYADIDSYARSDGEATSNNNKIQDNMQNSAKCILITGFPKSLYNDNPKKCLMFLAQLMQLQISENDIKNVTVEHTFYKAKYVKPDKLILIAEFLSLGIKMNFLAQKKMLKSHESAKGINVEDYVSEEVFKLYIYAKVLQNHGYKSVYCLNNCVYAKKPPSLNNSKKKVLITSHEEVDKLKDV